MVASWGTRLFVLAEDEEEAQALFKKQKAAVDTVEEVDRTLEAKEGTRSIRKSGTQVADVAGVADVADVENTKSKSKSKNKNKNKNKREDSTSSDHIVVFDV